MKKTTISLSLLVVALFVFVTSVRAEYQTIKTDSFVFGGNGGGGIVGSTVLDFSDIDNLDAITSFTLDLSLTLDSIAHITKTGTPPDFYTLQPGTYTGDIRYGVGIKTSEGVVLKSSVPTESFQGSYSFSGGTIGLGETLYSDQQYNGFDITQLIFLSDDFLNYLDENKQLTLDFTFTGPSGFLDFDYTGNNSYGFNFVSAAGTVVVGAYTPTDTTPEPATLLIFGLGVVALPLARCMRKK